MLCEVVNSTNHTRYCYEKKYFRSLSLLLSILFQLFISIELATFCQDEIISSIEQSQPTQVNSKPIVLKRKRKWMQKIRFRYRLSSVNAMCVRVREAWHICAGRAISMRMFIIQ